MPFRSLERDIVASLVIPKCYNMHTWGVELHGDPAQKEK